MGSLLSHRALSAGSAAAGPASPMGDPQARPSCPPGRGSACRGPASPPKPETPLASPARARGAGVCEPLPARTRASTPSRAPHPTGPCPPQAHGSRKHTSFSEGGPESLRPTPSALPRGAVLPQGAAPLCSPNSPPRPQAARSSLPTLSSYYQPTSEADPEGDASEQAHRCREVPPQTLLPGRARPHSLPKAQQRAMNGVRAPPRGR